MNVLSLFNGMSIGKMALEDAGISVNKYYISEIDKYANQATECLFPDSIQLGSVCDWGSWDIDWSSIDMVTGGFPCQAWSMAGKQLGDKDERGMLFWVMLDIMKIVRKHNPSADFLIENVKMKKEFEEYITHHTEQALGVVHKILINSALVSAQNRNRYYWTSFEASQPESKNLTIESVLEKDNIIDITEQVLAKPVGRAAYINCWKNMRKKSGLAKCLTASGQNIQNSSCTNVDNEDGTYRKLTPRECMRLQTIPEHYIDKLLNAGISNTQLYKMTGNAWTMKVISHILKCRY
jgi:DNA (cytosine-5)-methyltransferase 1/DNA (cytosine-5)-methyltransferase 3A